ncbi:hypothetical protein C2E21_3568 [Chlorella sorokiniana]|uniref:Uncharacterized protein n=1 Tax=Chlorella sorokiniana TaxID=3076 RepID=A0A2P6TUE1_CHLSO|nr:hypothetical protein C2E21_3568 [Chlorella sorokiniana]|eukprot:PRW57679.1 hypothetical protein C2E21_3568 [Chlorella sorokiniana]
MLLAPAPAAGACIPPAFQASSEQECSAFCSQRAPAGIDAQSQLNPSADGQGNPCCTCTFMAAPDAPPPSPPQPPQPPSPPATVPPPPPRPPRPPRCGNTENTLLPVEVTTTDEQAQAACQQECEWQQAERGPGWTIDPKPYAATTEGALGNSGWRCCACNFGRLSPPPPPPSPPPPPPPEPPKIFKVILSLEGVGFQMSDQQLRQTLGVLFNISGQRFQYATQQPSTQYSVPLLPAPKPPPADASTILAPAPAPAARRLMAAAVQRGRRLAQQQPEAAAPGSECNSSDHSVVGSPAACMVRCNGLLTPQDGETYAGPTGLLCCRCVTPITPSPRPRPPPPPAGEPDDDSLQRPYPAYAWFLPPPGPNATAPPGATGTYFFADAPVLMARVDSLKASLYGASANGYLKERLNAQGIATTNATTLYADIGDPYFVPPVIPAGNATAAAGGGSSSAGKIAGIAVGVAAALAAAAAAAWLFVRWRRRRQLEEAQAAAASEASKADSQRRFEEWRAQGGSGNPPPSPPGEHAEEISDAGAASDAGSDVAAAAAASPAADDVPAVGALPDAVAGSAAAAAASGTAQERALRTRLSDKPNVKRVGGGYAPPRRQL